MLRIPKGYFEAKKLVRSVRIIALWYTKNIRFRFKIETSFSITLGLISNDLLPATFNTALSPFISPFKKGGKQANMIITLIYKR